MGGDAKAARDYLDKFFNLDLVLTNPVPADLRDAVLGLLMTYSLVWHAATLPSLPRLSPMRRRDRHERPSDRNGIYARAYLLPQEARGR